VSRWRDTGGSRRDGGFSLIEVVVALGILSLVLVAVLPQLVTGIRATSSARGVSQAKGVAQGQLDRMRNLPFFIAHDAGDYRDVLDYYYKNLTAAAAPTCTSGGSYVLPTTASTGYVATGATRCSYEPAAGTAFYRTVTTTAASTGTDGYTMVVDTQFLSNATPPVAVTPSTGYDSQTTTNDSPPASQIGVTVTVLQSRRGTVKPVSTYTQIAKRLTSTTLVRAEGDARTIDIGSVTADGVPLALSAGLVSLTGGVSFASTAGANVAATSGSLATGESATGASATLSAPPAASAVAGSSAAGSLSTAGCSYACWGSTTSTALSVTAANAEPTIGSSTSPAQVLSTDNTNNVLSFGNALTAAGYRPALLLSPPLVRMDPTAGKVGSALSGCAASSSGTNAYLSAGGYLSTATTTPTVESCMVARATALELFPTTFAPHGVVRIELTSASARCLVSGSSHTPTATADYTAVVSYWNGTTYVTAATVVPGQTTDQLDAVPLTTSVGSGALTLGHYISSWSALTPDQVVKVSSSARAQVKVPGVVKIVSQPVRSDTTSTTGASDATSAVSVTVGALSCRAEDGR
jgi:prepilin-type N-terminal cleavage/methylation domain-containing protein